jgi:hypothetical protein
MHAGLAEDEIQIAYRAKMSKKKRSRTGSVVTAESVIERNNSSLNNGIYNEPPTFKKSKKNKQNQDTRTDIELIKSIFLNKQPSDIKTPNKKLKESANVKQVFESPTNLFEGKFDSNKLVHKKENLQSKFPTRKENETLIEFNKRVDDTARYAFCPCSYNSFLPMFYVDNLKFLNQAC